MKKFSADKIALALDVLDTVEGYQRLNTLDYLVHKEFLTRKEARFIEEKLDIAEKILA